MKKLLFVNLTILFVLIVVFAIGEIVLRIVPVPGIQFNVATIDDLTGVKFYPDSLVMYRNTRGESVLRRVNSRGYLDINHDQIKRSGVYRIGFYGDSFTQAEQVTLDATFFRQIESHLEAYNVESLAFGISGFSTLQAYLASTKETKYFDLDMVVYVFYENDFGDQIRNIKRASTIPYAILTDKGYEVDNSFREVIKFKGSIFFKIIDYLTARSLVAATLMERIKLLKQYGIKLKMNKEDRIKAINPKSSGENSMPNQGDPPSTWPAYLRVYASRLGFKIILKWRKEVESEGRKFVILYVPKENEWKKPTEVQDTWKPFLEQFALKENIDFIDPTYFFNIIDKQNKEIYFDHLTVNGHKALSNSFVKWFKKYKQISK